MGTCNEVERIVVKRIHGVKALNGKITLQPKTLGTEELKYFLRNLMRGLTSRRGMLL